MANIFGRTELLEIPFVKTFTYNRFEMIFDRDTAMAADANSSDQEREGPRRVVPADIQGHHGAKATHRVRRFQRR